jgi:DNA segregation ATPase FtsK/SpoIIIE, S-DNA-T family
VPLIQLLLPVVVVMLIGMVVIMITSGGGLSAGRFSPWYLMFPVFMLMSVMTMAAHTVGGGTSIGEINEDRKEYLRYLGVQRPRVQYTAKLQHSVLERDHPSSEVLQSLAGSARMCERQRDHPQFGRVRLGLGTQKLAQNVTTAQPQNGVTLQAIATTATGNTSQSTAAQTNISNATAVNTAVAVASLDQTMTALHAAIKTFGTVHSLSLFNDI